MSRKLSFLPQLHSRWDLRQLLHVGLVSSHLRWRSLHVKQPVRVLLGLSSGVASLALFLVGNGLLVGEALLDGGVAVLAMLTFLDYTKERPDSPIKIAVETEDASLNAFAFTKDLDWLTRLLAPLNVAITGP